jgi:hypothetical protein
MYLISAGARAPARIAIIAITIINSTNEKPLLFFFIILLSFEKI